MMDDEKYAAVVESVPYSGRVIVYEIENARSFEQAVEVVISAYSKTHDIRRPERSILIVTDRDNSSVHKIRIQDLYSLKA